MATQLVDPWAAHPSVICDFGWYGEGGAIPSNLTYVVNGVTYPPSGAQYQIKETQLNDLVFFDAIDSLTLGIPKTIVPTGINIVSWEWDLGNGQTASGPVVSTTYNYTVPPPDMASTLTVTDSLGRRTSTTHRLNLTSLTPIYGAFGEVRA